MDYSNPNQGPEKNDRENDNPFFNFAKPYFDFIEKGRVYILVYIVMALLSLMLPLVIIFIVIKLGFLQYADTKVVVAFMLSLLVIAFASWIGFQLWWNRKSGLDKFESADFIATPVISEILQTLGEWLGTLTCIIGAGVGIIITVLLWDVSEYSVANLGFGAINIGPLMLVGGPILGFFEIITFRFIAEQLRIFSALANNTRDIARNIKNKR